MTGVRDITSHALLESLNFIGQKPDPDTEAGPKTPSPQGTRSPSTFTNSAPSAASTSSEDPSRPDNMSSISYQTDGSSGGVSSSDSIDFMVGPWMTSMEAPSITPQSWQSLPTPRNANEFDCFEPHHIVPPLFGSDFPEPGLPDGTGMTNTASIAPHYDNTTSMIFNDFSRYHEPIGEIRPPEQDRPVQGDFGFDPASPLSNHSLGKIGDVGMMTIWHGYEKQAAHGTLENPPAGLQFSVCTTTLPETRSGQEDNPSTLPTNFSFHNKAVSPKELALATTSEHPSNTLPPARESGRASTWTANKRRRNSSRDSTSAKAQLLRSQKRLISLE
ncbi:hypothetical protein LTR84_010534 [Exophiala bonariae]|uniref:BZIP domain-containing protein n=1 Tax=Exophiala bonariae TaxID=1690606 RepID=A0AAV9MTN0_9EURO|nr:hypothetical protein LTR84_010534 [Exophiala bonariae]